MKCFFQDCKRKVNTFSSVACICGHFYCNQHKFTFEHNCSKTDTIKLNEKNNIKINNPVVKKDTWNLQF